MDHHTQRPTQSFRDKKERLTLPAGVRRPTSRPVKKVDGHEAFLAECIKSKLLVRAALVHGGVFDGLVVESDRFAINFLEESSGRSAWVFKHALAGIGLAPEPEGK
jgi:sRNA-binding regulator protein Hfq